MSFEANTYFIAPGTVIAGNGNSGTAPVTTVITNGVVVTPAGVIDFGFGTPERGVNVGIVTTQVNGDANVLFKTQTSDDLAQWFDNTIDEKGPVNTTGQRNIHCASSRRYMRLAWLIQANDPGEGSSNNSSSSSQSFNSSSSGGGNYITAYAALTIAATG